MEDIQTLGAQVNDLRVKLGKTALANPGKIGRTKLSEQLATLQAEHAIKFPPEEPRHVEPEVPVTEVKEPEPATATVVTEPEPATDNLSPQARESLDTKVPEDLDVPALLQFSKPETIKSASERLLQHVHFVDPADKRTVGLTYKVILALVLRKFPKEHTTVECLRWYAVHMRAEDKKLPQKRPRPLVHG